MHIECTSGDLFCNVIEKQNRTNKMNQKMDIQTNMETQEMKNEYGYNLYKELLSQDTIFLKSSMEKAKFYKKEMDQIKDKDSDIYKVFNEMMQELKSSDCFSYMLSSYFLWANSSEDSKIRDDIENLLLVPVKTNGWEDFNPAFFKDNNISTPKERTRYERTLSKAGYKNPLYNNAISEILHKRLKWNENIYELSSLDSLPCIWPFKTKWIYTNDKETYLNGYIISKMFNIDNPIIYSIKQDYFSQLTQQVSAIGISIESKKGIIQENDLLDILQKGKEHLTDDGIFIIIGKICEDIQLRKYLIDNCLLEAVFEARDTVYIISKNKRIDNNFGNPDEFKYIREDNASYDFYGQCLKIDSISYQKVAIMNYSLCGKNLNDINQLVSFENSNQEKSLRMNNLLERYKDLPHNDKNGKVFSMQNLASDYDSFICPIQKIKDSLIDSSFRKIEEPVLILNPKLSEARPTYVAATKDEPVYFDRKFWVICRIKDIIEPSYMFYLYQSGTWNNIIGELEYRSDWHCNACAVDDDGNDYFYASYAGGFIKSDTEEVFNVLPEYARRVDRRAWAEWDLFGGKYFPVPLSKEEQKRRVEDSRLMWKVMADRDAAREKLFEEKRWLNEQHIRNIKHRLRDEMTPIHIGIERLYKLMKDSNGVLQENAVFGKRSGQTVEDAFNNLSKAINQVETSLLALTEDPHFADKESLDIISLLYAYQKEKVISSNFHIEIVDTVEGIHPQIVCSHKDLYELLDYLVENASRHGFRDSNRMDYCVRIELFLQDIDCHIVVSNNGIPMSERAQNIYFVRGSYAEETGNSGIGGARVKEIVDHFGGTVYLCNDQSDFPVKIEMIFPIINM